VLPEDSKELIQDILEISRAGYVADNEAELATDEEDSEEDEVASWKSVNMCAWAYC